MSKETINRNNTNSMQLKYLDSVQSIWNIRQDLMN
jgi:hypothetical protein